VVIPGLIATGEIPRRNEFEVDRSPRFRDPKGRIQDTLPDDQALVIDSSKGAIVIVGCAHAGVINTLDYVRETLSPVGFRAVLGGMHLFSAERARLAATVEGFRRHDVQLVVPMHCTGWHAASLFRNELGERCRFAGAGTVFEF
jgi:7,8-dihydropterin-6-yl-methyl-4-(beta-D-ribofuranosyl)aminobenzene 5'-phosphate synthase